MKDRIYGLLVNRVPGIRERYLNKRNQNHGMNRYKALFYLLWLNIQYYLLFQRNIGQSQRCPFYEEKILYNKDSESSLSKLDNPEVFAQKLMKYDVISFDVFDTLILRSISNPTDVFFFVGMKLQYPDFKRIRIEAEQKARQIKYNKKGTWEISLEEIWDVIENETGISKQTGIKTELEYEKIFCKANPYMLKVIKELQKANKKIIITSDMYLGKDFIKELLSQCGYDTFYKYYVSCDYNKSKHDGSLYEIIKQEIGGQLTYVHIGDHEFSDKEQALMHNIKAYLYNNVNHIGNKYRTEDMSAITGSIYRAIINNHIHNGLSNFSREYEYGFIYGGLFVTGYCRFIHDYIKSHNTDKILFLSRDGAVLVKAYNLMYPEENKNTEYVYWSRLAAIKLSAQYYKNDYFRRFLYHKVNQKYTIRQIMQSMELTSMLESLCSAIKIHPEMELTYKNVEKIKKYLIDSWQQVLKCYEEQINAGKQYYSVILNGCKSVAAVDIGWAGSGAVMLNYIVNNIWNISCTITGIIAGTNTCLSLETDAMEQFLLNGQLVSYMYSQYKNRDLWKLHDPAKNHNLYWELLLGDSNGSLKGFYFDHDGNYELKFKEDNANKESIYEIHRGILDFVQQFLQLEKRIDHIIPISGRDAYAPMINIENKKNKKFMKDLEGLMDEIHIG